MSTESPTAATAQSWPVLSVIERRILGVLVEKAKTTPDAYPLSLNALVTGSNQKNNRDPVMNVGEEDVEAALPALQSRGLVTCIQGGRVERWRHNLYEVWGLSKVEMAVIAELLLRGAQTEGELRGRASRMEPIADLEQLRGILGPLSGRGLAVFLGPEGRRGTLLTHGFLDPRELDAARQRGHEESAAAASGTSGAAHVTAGSTTRLQELEQGLTQLREEVAALRAIVEKLQASR